MIQVDIDTSPIDLNLKIKRNRGAGRKSRILRDQSQSVKLISVSSQMINVEGIMNSNAWSDDREVNSNVSFACLIYPNALTVHLN